MHPETNQFLTNSFVPNRAKPFKFWAKSPASRSFGALFARLPDTAFRQFISLTQEELNPDRTIPDLLQVQLAGFALLSEIQVELETMETS